MTAIILLSALAGTAAAAALAAITLRNYFGIYSSIQDNYLFISSVFSAFASLCGAYAVLSGGAGIICIIAHSLAGSISIYFFSRMIFSEISINRRNRVWSQLFSATCGILLIFIASEIIENHNGQASEAFRCAGPESIIECMLFRSVCRDYRQLAYISALETAMIAMSCVYTRKTRPTISYRPALAAYIACIASGIIPCVCPDPLRGAALAASQIASGAVMPVILCVYVRRMKALREKMQ